jgi:dTDP-4-dehydrorhamnose reductase
LIFGKHGQVGNQLITQLASRQDYEVIATDIEDVDLTDNEATRALIMDLKPAWVVNTSAHTAVDLAESEQSLARQLNAVAPAVIARACQEIGASMVHYSTDYVFDGKASAPYLETDTPNPESVYGITKLEGEHAVMSALDNFLILRTAWVYAKTGKNFVNTMLRLAKDRDVINVVNDQFGSPTLADDLAMATIHMIDQIRKSRILPRYGIYHATGNGTTSWSGLAETIMQLSGNAGVRINPIPGSEYPTAAPRPDYSVLSNQKLKQIFDIQLPHWEHALNDFLGNTTREPQNKS